MMYYDRASIMEAIGGMASFDQPVEMLLDAAGLDPFLSEVARAVADETERVAVEVALLRGVLIGLALRGVEAPVDEQEADFINLASLPDGIMFNEFEKVGRTRLARMNGPFTVKTKEGVARCEDGWLAVDADGDLYPVADSVFKQSYRLAL